MPHRYAIGVSLLALTVVASALRAHETAEQNKPASIPTLDIPEDAGAAELLARARRLMTVDPPAEGSAAQRLMWSRLTRQEAIRHVDALLERHPDTPLRADALILKLEALAELARRDPVYLDQLLIETRRIAAEKPEGRLAAENDYFSIQAFVLGARSEQMSQQRQWLGAAERYEAFLENHPDSPRVPLIRASYVRTLLALDRTAEARTQLRRLEADHPEHDATRRARGELYRATAVGRPFTVDLGVDDGPSIAPADLRGHVVIVHFWASWDRQSVSDFDALKALAAAHGDDGLKLVGVSVDYDLDTARKAVDAAELTWPQIIEGHGFESEPVVEAGVVRLPTYFVVDRAGVVRQVTTKLDFADRVEALLQKPVPDREE